MHIGNERKNEVTLTRNWITRTENKIEDIVQKAIRKEPKQIDLPGKRRRKTKNKSIRLLEVFRDKKKEILLFLRNDDVLFDKILRREI